MAKQKPKLENFADAMKRFHTGLGGTEKTVAGKSAAKKQTAKTAKKDAQSVRIERNPSNQDDFDKLVFVNKACSNDDKRPFTTVVHAERTRTGCRLVATDGRRLHVAETNLKIASGNYKLSATKDAVSLGTPVPDILFPNWARVIPDGAKKKTEIDLADTGIGKNVKQSEKLSQTFNAFVKKTGLLINLRFLEDLPKTDWVVYTQKEKDKAFVLKQKTDPNGAFAVIMPLPIAA